MIAPTHVTFASFIYLLILTTAGVSLSAVNAIVTLVASILPDLDTGASYIGRALPWISGPIERRFGHRTLTHSLPFTAALGLILLPVASADVGLYACFLTGYVSHPVLDSMTTTGVHLFYPLSNVRCVFPLEVNNPRKYRIETGSRGDRLLGLAFLAACVPSFFVASQGYVRFVRTTQRDIESAVRDYNDMSRRAIVFGRVKAHDLLSKDALEGRFEIVGTLDDRTLLFKAIDGSLHTLGMEYRAEYAADEIICEEGPPARVSMQTVDLAGRPLGDVRRRLDARAGNQLFGTLELSEQAVLPPSGNGFATIRANGRRVQLLYASLRDIEPMCDIWVERGNLTVRTIAQGDVATVDAEAEPATDGGSASPYERVAIPFPWGMSFRPLCERGDTVRPGDTLVSTGTTRDGLRIGAARSRFLEDSIGFEHMKRMFDSGYVSAQLVGRAEVTFWRSRNRLRELLESPSGFTAPVGGIVRDIRIDTAGTTRRILVTIEKR